MDRKKGQIYYVKLKDSVAGKKKEFNAKEIKEMYLFPEGFEKLTQTTGYIFNLRQ